MRCRWVLTWKPTPEESLDEARQEVSERTDSTTLTADARRKAKARIVLLGYEHPDLLTEAHKTSSPVQAVLTSQPQLPACHANGMEHRRH